jgi:hypothetical protein
MFLDQTALGQFGPCLLGQSTKTLVVLGQVNRDRALLEGHHNIGVS